MQLTKIIIRLVDLLKLRIFCSIFNRRFAIMDTTTAASEVPTNSENKEVKQPTETPKIPFICKMCNFKIDCEYKDAKPKFAKNIQFSEKCYLIQDPFSPPPGNLSTKSTCEHFIVLGSDCVCCGHAVCQQNACSIFYRNTYCIDCAYQFLNTFPVEVQSKIQKFCRTASGYK